MAPVTDPLVSRAGSRPHTAEGSRAFVVRPFQRLARTHVANNMADAMLAAALADSIFFSLPADNARGPVLRYLIITMAPFIFIAPLIGPLIDRLKGGHRFVLLGTLVARAVIAWLLIDQIADDTPGPLFFLLALLVLVGQRAYSVARSALVPTVVTSDDELIEANSKLTILGGFAGFVGILPAALLLKIWGPGWALGLAVVTYGVGAVIGLRIPGARVATEKRDAVERKEIRGAGIQLAGGAMSLLRGCVGFLTMLIAFDFRGGDKAAWQFGLVAGVSVIAGLVGAAVASRLKGLTSEETILTASLGLVVSGAFAALFINEVSGACIVGACVGFAASLGKLAFDSILQRDAPDANRGRSFARFETRFQIFYVLGSLIPVAFHVGARPGFAVLLVASAIAIISYAIGRMAWAHRSGQRQTAATAAAVGIEERFGVVTGEVKDRLAAAPRSVMHRLRGGEGAAEPDLGPDPDRTVIIDAAVGADADEWTVPAVPTVPTPTVPTPTPPAPLALAVDQGDEIDAVPSWGGDPTTPPRDPEAVLFDQDVGPDGDGGGEVPPAGPVDPHLAPTSPVAWNPPADEAPTIDAARTQTRRVGDQSELPWDGPPEGRN
ncbi:MAG: putative major facilitator superfamily transporter [Ilumatobacteraceae bacterium]|nr:putative major facilitator superfamily transporter [Ilumatobacteraceae bacterium]